MKKLFFMVVAFIFSTMAAIAAEFDLIIKTNSEKIEAIIQEVSSDELRFKKVHNPSGPTFVLKLDEVSSIIYANGEVQAIEHRSHFVESEISNAYKPNDGRLHYVGSNTYTINGQTLKGKELEYFLAQNCPQAFDFYKKQEKIENTGWSFLAIGSVLCLPVGVTLYVLAPYVSRGEYSIWSRCYISGSVCMGLGAGMTVAAIPMIACGHTQKKTVDQEYNVQCVHRSAFNPQLKFTAGANGLGIALAF